MNAALTQLGFKVYDAPENMTILLDEYSHIFQEGWTTEYIKKMYEGVDAVMDMPACIFWDEIHKAYPDSKVKFKLLIRECQGAFCVTLKVATLD